MKVIANAQFMIGTNIIEAQEIVVEINVANETYDFNDIVKSARPISGPRGVCGVVVSAGKYTGSYCTENFDSRIGTPQAAEKFATSLEFMGIKILNKK